MRKGHRRPYRAKLELSAREGRGRALVRPEDPIDGLVMERQIRYAGWELSYLTGANATGHPLVDAILGLVEHHASGEYLRKLARDSLRNLRSSQEVEAGVQSGSAQFKAGYPLVLEHAQEPHALLLGPGADRCLLFRDRPVLAVRRTSAEAYGNWPDLGGAACRMDG